MVAPSVSPASPQAQGDDEFDWEAAVREIDFACQTVASTSNHDNLSISTILHVKSKKYNGSHQTTLDKFVGSDARLRECPPSEAKHVYPSCDNNTGPKIDLEAVKTWIYPVNVPLRDYQLSITETALFSNTLVALPTGLGKTLIAAVVMYNYFRWFPEGKIVFTAPSRPLVMQQIEACHNITGITQDWTIDMTGQMSPSKRQHLWKTKRVFFVTPQVLEKDIQSGICLMKQLVCLVIDEAHRATGNYSYCVAVRELMAMPMQLRIVALTATPGSKQKTIQNVIDNLHISTLEYRNESDNDVSRYVHNRKIELLEVSMGKDASEINDLLLEAIRPFGSRLCSAGVLYRNDFAMLSPCDLLTSREKFRQAPPESLSHAMRGEIDGCFGVLITLYHVRKLLSSHGIRPAYEMLEERLKQGSFARIMSKNEKIWKVKLLMQQSLSHGAPNLKLLKMTEVLIDHFKSNNPKDSRVIIFSNFRGSVKDIMFALATTGEFIRATQFIGQSSGKSLKGQTQKIQQEVLKKFRAGEYNVIVATSIGEEGLDIMEVDLVICFDANISPLRMIQRMGRTGRKHDGRVVVLACQGPELKGYLRKQASSKAVGKHMNNGGSKSFDFHCSPRMVPHIYKPQVLFVELAIEQFIPRGRKKKDLLLHEPAFRKEITKVESDIITKYFYSSEDIWRPSLISFPFFQTFPSSVYIAMHSSRTSMLIDTMQSLQGSLSFETKNTYLAKVSSKPSSHQHKDFINTMEDEADKKFTEDRNLKASSESKILDAETLPRDMCEEEDAGMLNLAGKSPPVHSFLFGTGLISVNASGKVLIASLPGMSSAMDNPSCLHVVSNFLVTDDSSWTSPIHDDKPPTMPNINIEQMGSVERMPEKKPMMASPFSESDSQVDFLLKNDESLTPNCKDEIIDLEYCVEETPTHVGTQSRKLVPSMDNLKDEMMSPRLTFFLEEGVVPESPVAADHVYSAMETPVIPVNLLPSPPRLCDHSASKNTFSESKMVNISCSVDENNVKLGSIMVSPLNEFQSSLVNKRDHSSSEDWQLNSVEALKSVEQPPKFKRLRKYVDVSETVAMTSNEAQKANRASLCRLNETTVYKVKHVTGKQKPKNRLETFIDDEAEVSNDAEVSEEEDDVDGDEQDDSFIDDRMSSPSGNHAEVGGSEMMAIYRKSLLSQSPLIQSKDSTEQGLESVSSMVDEPGSHSKMTINALETPQSISSSRNRSPVSNSATCRWEVKKYLLSPVPEVHAHAVVDESKLESRKRKLCFQVPSVSIISGQQCSSHTMIESHICQPNSVKLNGELFDDDQFYQGLDLDALEALAAETLQCKSSLSFGSSLRENSSIARAEGDIDANCVNPPSFDLGV